MRPNLAHFLLALILAVAGCSAFYGPPFDGSRFVSAATALDGQAGVFTMKRLVYRPAAGLLAFPDGGVPRYLVDRNYLARYDFASGALTILHREDALRQDWLPGSSSFFVAAACGPKVIVRTSGQLKGSYASRSETWWYDLASGMREPLPLESELTERGVRLKYFYLIDPGGTLVLMTGREGVESTRNGGWVLVRHPDGSYEVVGEVADYYGMRQGEIFYWSPQNRFVAYRLGSGARREPDRSEYAGLAADPRQRQADEPSLVAEQGEISHLVVGRRQGEGWHYEPLPFTVGQAAGE